MSPIVNGIALGFFLSILIGPILFALVQAGIEQGFRAGAMVGLGIWLSDILFIASVFYGIAFIREVTELQGFELYLGIIGGIILILFGVGSFYRRPIKVPPPDSETPVEAVLPEFPFRKKSYFALWLKGFLVNTLNPFTVFFWVSMSAVVIENDYTSNQAVLFFTSLMLVVIATDSLKVYAAKKVRKFLKPKYILTVRKISGAAFILFGIALIVRVMV